MCITGYSVSVVYCLLPHFATASGDAHARIRVFCRERPLTENESGRNLAVVSSTEHGEVVFTRSVQGAKQVRTEQVRTDLGSPRPPASHWAAGPPQPP